MKLTTKRNRWFFRRELFSYMIPLILIVATVDVFFNFMRCPLHPEWSAPCDIIRLNAAGYGIFLIITIIFAAFSAKKLRKVKKKIETEFLKTANHSEQAKQKEEIEEEKSKEVEEIKFSKPKKIIAKNNKSEKEPKTMSSKKVSTKKKTTKK